jgi:6,7-dimethyl-8-ribityllumazine synthase
VFLCGCLVALTTIEIGFAHQQPLQFGGAYAGLGDRRQRLVDDCNIVGVVTLGAVIRGETTHDVHINRSVSTALMQLSIDYNKPIAFGLLTVNSLEQAIQRSGGNKGNKGEECAQALLECLSIGSRLNELKRNHGKSV